MDINPGDRAEVCCGMMEPISVERRKGANYIVQKCQKCGLTRHFKTSPNDDFDNMVAISKKNIIG